jgi:hypothetical protein
MTDTPLTDALEQTPLFRDRPPTPTTGEALLHARKLERENERLREQVVEARREACKWQDAWVNETPLEEVGCTLMPWEKIFIRECKSNARDHRWTLESEQSTRKEINE